MNQDYEVMLLLKNIIDSDYYNIINKNNGDILLKQINNIDINNTNEIILLLKNFINHNYYNIIKIDDKNILLKKL